MCFFQEKFQESLKRLRQEQQEAEKLKAIIIEKRTYWKVKEIIPKCILGQESGHGSQGQGDLILSPVWLEELAFASSFTAALPKEGIVLGAVGGEKES